VIKTLTIISVVLLPMTLLASIYGMNIPLPLENNPFAFPLVVGLMLAGALSMIAYFRWQDWL
jgi:magnesium transporter